MIIDVAHRAPHHTVPGADPSITSVPRNASGTTVPATRSRLDAEGTGRRRSGRT
jgi:hypothetical protein